MRTITMDGPAMNALGTGMMDFVERELDAADGGPVLLTGTGKAFSAGLDLREVVSLDVDGMRAFLGKLVSLCMRIYRHPAPTVALVNGHAIAGGAILALACDVRIGTTDPRARMGLNEVALGLVFPPAILELCRRRIPQASHVEVLLGGQLHSMAAALALGMLDRCEPEPGPVAQARLAALASHPPLAYAAMKASLSEGILVTAEDEARFMERWLPVWTGDELKAKVRALLGG